MKRAYNQYENQDKDLEKISLDSSNYRFCSYSMEKFMD
jgi:hypothetical protein